VWASNGEMRIADLAGLKLPVWAYEHASSHRRQPVHFWGKILRTLTLREISVSSGRLASQAPR
jgi:hypothetical protein